MLIGLHGHQFPAQREDKLSQLRIPVWTVLNMDFGWYRKFDRPDMRWIIRIYDTDCMGHPPEQWADRCHREMTQLIISAGGDPKRFILQGYNELNLDLEHNGQGYAGKSWDSDEGFRLRLDWLMRFHRTLVGFNLPYRVGAPWDSPGHQDIDGRQEVKLYAQAGLYDLVDVFGGHYYAEGPDRGGFDAPDREWYSDRVLKVRAMLDSNGRSALPIWIGECNRKMVDVGDVLAEYDRYCGRIAGSVEAITWFIWSSGDPAFGDMQWSKIADRAPAMQAIIDKYAGVQPGPIPPDPEPPDPEPPVPTDPMIAKYNLKVTETTEIEVLFDDDTSGQVELVALMAPGISGSLRTADGQHGVDGTGRLSVIMGGTSSYFPEAGQHGPWIATCQGARVEGLGMKPNHHHPKTVFARRTTPPDPGPQPPATGHEWFGAFSGHAAAAGLAPPTGDIIYLPDHFRSAVQENDTVILVWDGKRVHEVRK